MRLSFSKRELEIIEALGKGHSAKKIGEAAGAKEETIHAQVEELQRKLHADTQAQIPERFREVTGWANAPTKYSREVLRCLFGARAQVVVGVLMLAATIAQTVYWTLVTPPTVMAVFLVSMEALAFAGFGVIATGLGFRATERVEKQVRG
jgi:DNA-binding CsgD family transcriptional regulator